MKYLFWDIDGTLLLTNLAGVTALKSAIQELYHVPDFTFSHSLAGRTDTFIATQALREIKGGATAAEVNELLDCYIKSLPTYLKQNHGHLLTNVAETLSFLQQRKDMLNLLLTGNCEAGAKAKLHHFGLDHYFDYSLSAFGEISELRDDLAKAAFQKIQKINTNLDPQDIIIIGDTPRDITCAQAIGAKALIVEDGSTYSREELLSYHPWKIIPQLPACNKELLAILEGEALC